MPNKLKKNNHVVTSQEFNERLNKVDKRFEEIDKKIDNSVIRLSKEIIKNSEEIKILKETVATKEDVQKIITAIDSFAGKTEDHERKAITNTHRLNELEPKVEGHEKRIATLESHIPPRP